MMANSTPTRKWRRLLKWLLAAPTILLAAMAVIIAFTLGSETGRLWLAHSLIQQLNNSAGITLEMDGLTSAALGQWRADQLRIKRNQALWIEIQQLQFEWLPDALLNKNIVIESLAAQSLTLYNLPATPGTGAEPGKMAIPALNFWLKQLKVARFRAINFGPSRASQAAYTLSGSARWYKQQPLSINIAAQSLGATATRLDINSHTLDLKTVAIEGSLDEEAGGLLGELLKLPVEQPIRAGFTLRLAAQKNRFNLNLEQLTFPLGSRSLNVTSDFSLARDHLDLRIEKLTLAVDDTEHHLSGHLSDQLLNLNLVLDQFPLDLLTPWLDDLSSGDVSATAAVSGTLSNPSVSANASARLIYNSLPASVDLSGSASKSGIELQRLTGQLLGAKLTAQGKVDLTGQSTRLNASLNNLELEQLTRFGLTIPEGLQGNVHTARAELYGPLQQLEGTLQLDGSGHYQQQSFQLETDLSKSSDTITIHRADVKALQAEATISGRVNARSLQSDLQLNIDRLPLSTLAMTGVQLAPGLSAQLDTRLAIRGALQNPHIEGRATLGGHYKEIPVTLSAKASYRKDQIEVQSLQLTASQEVVLNAAGSYLAPQFDLQATVEKMPRQLLSALGWEIQPGNFNAQIALKGSAHQPQISGHLAYDTLLAGAALEGEHHDSHFAWELDASTSNDTLRLLSRFKHNSDKPAQLLIEIPIAPYVTYLSGAGNAARSSDLPLNARVVGSLDLKSLAFLLDPDLHRIHGVINSDLALSGTTLTPGVSGEVTIDSGGYANSLTGTVIQDIHCTLVTTEKGLTIHQCAASDGHSGKYALSGLLQLPEKPDAGVIDITLQAQNASILRRPDIESEATGAIHLRGDFKTLLAAGSLEASPFMATIDSALNHNTPQIDVEEVYAQPVKTSSLADQYHLPHIRLDLLIGASQQAYLRGRGLEAEMQGKIRLQGDLQNPIYDGNFKTLRGQFEVFGKKFKLEQGSVTLANNAMALSIAGTYSKNGQQIRAEISGTSDNLSLSLSANPVMAEDEILAFIIFGKSLQKITPFEAVQLASAVQKLRKGDAGAFDPVGSTREFLGVDTLTLESEKTDDGNYGVNLGIGKYLNDKVYLEIERTPNPSQPWRGNVQIELTPKWNLESSTGGETGLEGIELRWKHDY